MSGMTEEAAKLQELPFGKYQGKKLGWVVRNDPGYLKWLATECDIQSPSLREAVGVLHEDDDEDTLDGTS